MIKDNNVTSLSQNLSIPFKIISEYKPSGDQPKAIKQLIKNIASGELLDLMRRAKCFGINLARLDIRQESSRHSQLISEFVKKRYKKDYLKMGEKEKIQFLKSQILSKKNPSQKLRGQAKYLTHIILMSQYHS